MLIKRKNCFLSWIFTHYQFCLIISGPDCEDNKGLDHLCMLIPGDATLYSLFRVDAQAQNCPFQ
jgi:hypothetical protein